MESNTLCTSSKEKVKEGIWVVIPFAMWFFFSTVPNFGSKLGLKPHHINSKLPTIF